MDLFHRITGKLTTAGLATKALVVGGAAVVALGAVGAAGVALTPSLVSHDSAVTTTTDQGTNRATEAEIQAALNGTAQRSDTATAKIGEHKKDKGDKTCPAKSEDAEGSNAAEGTDNDVDGTNDAEGTDGERVARGDANNDGHADCGRHLGQLKDRTDVTDNDNDVTENDADQDDQDEARSTPGTQGDHGKSRDAGHSDSNDDSDSDSDDS